MYLKRLQVQGFKTFANKTEFLYDQGMTAVVGPNGSGKSNIADAIRWVLGEQRYSVLRSRKTEDVIFAGSALKSAMGYAEASITFDNTDGKLPLDFNEVTVTRRAYRTGENEYYINRSRVRLKDVAEALMPLSQAYTVITQGMVDAALSQKPEERRSLFEDAADIGRYNLKKAEAEDKLNKTEDNSRRVSDLLAEITPRLKSLERSARQAEEYYSLQEELQTYLKRHWSHHYQLAAAALEKARHTEQEAQKRLAASKSGLENLKEEIGSARAVQTERRNWLAEKHHESSSLHNRAQQLQQKVAVDQERLNGLLRQREVQALEMVNLKLAEETATRKVAELEKEFQNLRESQKGEREQQSAQEAVLKEKAGTARSVEEKLAKRREQLVGTGNRLESIKSRNAQIRERREELIRQEEKYNQARQTTVSRQSQLQIQIEEAKIITAGLEERVVKQNSQRQALEKEIASSTANIRQLEQKIGGIRSKRDSSRARLDLMQRLQTSFAGLYGGVKNIMQASQPQAGRPAQLSGIAGLVANLLEAPIELELAIETALGGHLQDIVVEKWSDAEEAIAYLNKSGAGRATFLPLDSLRPYAAPDARGQKVYSQKARLQGQDVVGLRGVAIDLIKFDERYRVVYEQLLGRVLVCEDLNVARTVLGDLAGGWTAVTLGGEIVRSGGAVTGGGSGREKERAEGSVLMRERELRELPESVSRLEKQLQDETSALSRLQAQLADFRKQQQESDREVQRLSREQQQAHDKEVSLRSQFDRLSDELRMREENSQSLAQERAVLNKREEALELEKRETGKEQEQHQQLVEAYNRETWAAQAAENEEREKLAALRTTFALAEQRTRTSEINLRLAKTELVRLQDQIKIRDNQIGILDVRQQELHTALKSAEQELQSVSLKLEELRFTITPLEQELEKLEQSQAEKEEQWSLLSTNLLSIEGEHGRALIETQRASGEIQSIKLRAAEDLAPSFGAQGNSSEIMADPFHWQELLDMDEKEAHKNQEKIEQLRNKLRRIGLVNPLALQEFREAKQRHEFLSLQLADLEQASSSLRALIKQLDALTQSRFAVTFEQVAEHFKKYFILLFNGGAASLTLTTPDKVADTGIEIMAQPPGKRQQTLALLSGGERALTAVALLFALLEVNPTPFCVLDEVDAALDEANVNRFCQTLQLLSQNTQFIVITHNRGTIEAARTIYGVSMGADSISKIISLKVDEVAAFKETGSRANKKEKAAAFKD